jgi:hypothetical protein
MTLTTLLGKNSPMSPSHRATLGRLLPRPPVGILPHNQDLDTLVGRVFERVEVRMHQANKEV